LNIEELRQQIAQEIIDYAKSYNMADVGTDLERCLCDASICLHEGLYIAASIAEGNK
jgi:hypothetical protein